MTTLKVSQRIFILPHFKIHMDEKVEQKDTVLAAVAYLLTWLTGLIIYFVTDKKDRFTRFHAFQSILFGIVVTVVGILLSIIGSLLSLFNLRISAGYIPPVAAITIGIISWLFWIVIIVIIIICAVNAYSGKLFELPIIGKAAKKHIAAAEN